MTVCLGAEEEEEGKEARYTAERLEEMRSSVCVLSAPAPLLAAVQAIVRHISWWKRGIQRGGGW